ncbi:hypothetical protein ABPG75_008965 [Micractinium tetrahymenae]
MRLLTDIYLNLLGMGELLENAGAVLQDRLGRKRPAPRGLQGKTAIVTGGNAGVGYATAEALLAAGSDVVLACRSLERAQDAAALLAAAAAARAARSGAQAGGPARASSPAAGATHGAGSSGGPAAAEEAGAAPPGKVEVELLDLASLDSVRRFAARWEASGRRLDLLVLNAGIMCPPDRLESADGLELQFQSNFLAHFELANRLVRHAQRQRRRAQQGGRAQQGQQQARPLRVLWLTSMTHWGGDLSPGELADVPYCRQRYIPFQAYANSKLCTLLAAKHLDRLFARDAAQQAGGAAGSGATATVSGQQGRDMSVAVHPGLVDTFLARNYFKGTAPRVLRPLTDPFFERFFCPRLLRSPEAAAQTVLYAATAPAQEVGGAYVGTAPRVGHHSRAAGDPALAARVWELGAHLCQLGEEDLVA